MNQPNVLVKFYHNPKCFTLVVQMNLCADNLNTAKISDWGTFNELSDLL